ncbi:hypothetical protein AVEN_131898-1, partial [Araneus ventricosus]
YAVARCPRSTEDTFPCECQTNGGIDSLNCVLIKDAETLERIFRRSFNTHFTLFMLMKSRMKFIPSKYLKPRAVERIVITDSELNILFDKAPDASNIIEDILMTNVSFQGVFPWHQFKTLHKLYMVSLTLVDLPVLGTAFKRSVSKNVKLVMLSSTNTKEVDDEIFSEYRQLKDIRIGHGQLKILKRNYFPRPANIELFYFNGNQIRTLPYDLFEDMPKLRSVNLSGNKISTISEAVFSPVKKRLSVLFLEKNPIDCGCSFKWILSLPEKIVMYGNCVSPEDLEAKRIRDLTKKDFEYCN